MMAQAIGYDSEEDVIQNLRDAGCDQKIIKTFMAYMDQDDLNSQMRLMDEQRKRLLDRVHEEEKKIDCLDYLVHQMGRSRNKN